MSAPVAEFNHQTSNLSRPSIVHPVLAKRDIAVAASIGEGAKSRLEEDEVVKPNQKRKTKWPHYRVDAIASCYSAGFLVVYRLFYSGLVWQFKFYSFRSKCYA
jgi:hypothetical protein